MVENLGVKFCCDRDFGGGIVLYYCGKVLAFLVWVPTVVEFLGWIINLLLCRRNHCYVNTFEFLEWVA